MQKELTTKQSRTRKLIYRITVSAVFLSLALVTKTLTTFNVPIFGAGGMKVGFSGIFTAFPAFLFGPLYGGVVSAASDILGTIIKPDGAYIPWLTVAAFCGGFIKGTIWKLLTNRSAKRLRIVAAALLLFVGASGIAFHVSLASSGITHGIVAYKDELPTRGAVEQLTINPLTEAVTSLAQYNNDTITLTCADDPTSLPSHVSIDGYVSKITKIADGAIPVAEKDTEIYIPSSYKTISDNAFADVSNYTIVSEEGSAAQLYAEANGIPFKAADESKEYTLITTSDATSGEGFSVKSSDTYRKYLAGYINFATLGLEITALAGLIIILADLITAKVKAKKSDKKSEDAPYFKIFLSIFASGFFVTTVNTEILRRFLAVWNGRAFVILWIPRIIEEMLVCIFQAYIISLLYGVYTTRIQKKRT